MNISGGAAGEGGGVRINGFQSKSITISFLSCLRLSTAPFLFHFPETLIRGLGAK